MGHEKRKRRRGRFSKEFKRDAVALVLETGRPIRHVAEELGIYDTTLGNWVRDAEGTDASDDDAQEPDVDEAARVRQLEREVAELRRERDLLKRTVAFWVKESTP